MLVATASAAPTRPRRRWSVAAPIAAFALAGALTGTVSATALNATNTPEDDPPVSMDNSIAEFVHGDTQLIGEPVHVSGQDETVIPLGAKPEGATELGVILRCQGAGTFNVLIDGQPKATVICDEDSSASAGGGSYFTVEDRPTHAVTVDAGDGARYAVWASWAARAVPPAQSPELAEAITDGEVSEAEYHAQFDRYSQCMTAAGYPLGSINKSDTVITYNNSGAAVTSAVEGRCYAEHFLDVDMAWQSARAPQTSPEQAR
jgi:hypothetical protein